MVFEAPSSGGIWQLSALLDTIECLVSVGVYRYSCAYRYLSSGLYHEVAKDDKGATIHFVWFLGAGAGHLICRPATQRPGYFAFHTLPVPYQLYAGNYFRVVPYCFQELSETGGDQRHLFSIVLGDTLVCSWA